MIEEMKLPFVHKNVVEYLEKVYDIDECLHRTRNMTSEQSLGFMRGSRDVISTLKALLTQQEAKL